MRWNKTKIKNATRISELDWPHGLIGFVIESIVCILLVVGFRYVGCTEQRFRYAFLLAVLAFIMNIVGVISTLTNYLAFNIMDSIQVILETMTVLYGVVLSQFFTKKGKLEKREVIFIGCIFTV